MCFRFLISYPVKNNKTKKYCKDKKQDLQLWQTEEVSKSSAENKQKARHMENNGAGL